MPAYSSWLHTTQACVSDWEILQASLCSSHSRSVPVEQLMAATALHALDDRLWQPCSCSRHVCCITVEAAAPSLIFESIAAQPTCQRCHAQSAMSQPMLSCSISHQRPASSPAGSYASLTLCMCRGRGCRRPRRGRRHTGARPWGCRRAFGAPAHQLRDGADRPPAQLLSPCDPPVQAQPPHGGSAGPLKCASGCCRQPGRLGPAPRGCCEGRCERACGDTEWGSGRC